MKALVTATLVLAEMLFLLQEAPSGSYANIGDVSRKLAIAY